MVSYLNAETQLKHCYRLGMCCRFIRNNFIVYIGPRRCSIVIETVCGNKQQAVASLAGLAWLLAPPVCVGSVGLRAG